MTTTTCTVLLFLAFVGPVTAFYALCPSYCNTDGYYTRGFYCHNPNAPVFCCGNATYRHCCTEPHNSIGDNVPPRYECPRSSFWLFNWQVFVGTLTGLILICLLAACCYFTCEQFKADRGPLARRLRRRRESSGVSVPMDLEFQNMPPPALDPVTGNIILPAYDNLPKDPPTYAEIMGITVPGSAEVASTSSPDVQAQASGTSAPASTTPTTTTTTASAPASNSESAVQQGAPVVSVVASAASTAAPLAAAGVPERVNLPGTPDEPTSVTTAATNHNQQTTKSSSNAVSDPPPAYTESPPTVATTASTSQTAVTTSCPAAAISTSTSTVSTPSVTSQNTMPATSPSVSAAPTTTAQEQNKSETNTVGKETCSANSPGAAAAAAVSAAYDNPAYVTTSTQDLTSSTSRSASDNSNKTTPPKTT